MDKQPVLTDEILRSLLTLLSNPAPKPPTYSELPSDALLGLLALKTTGSPFAQGSPFGSLTPIFSNPPMMRTETYIAFDGDADLMSYRTIQGWSADPWYPFVLNNAHDINYARDDSLPESIISQLRERLEVSKHLVLIVGSATNRNRKSILQYEIRYALRQSLPIILVFKGFSSDERNDERLWREKLWPKIPALLRDWTEPKYCLVCPFTREPIVKAIHTYSVYSLPQTSAHGYAWAWT